METRVASRSPSRSRGRVEVLGRAGSFLAAAFAVSASPPVRAQDAPARAASVARPVIAIDDPLLDPVPPAPHTLAGWRDAVSLVRARSTELRVAVEETERARGLARQALAAALPSVTATGTLTHHLIRGTDISPNADPTKLKATIVPRTPAARADIVITQPLLAPKVWYTAGTAYRAVEAAALTAEDRERTVLAGVANAIVAVVTSERAGEINRSGLRSALERLELMNQRLRLGAGNDLDILRAEQDVTLARSSLVAADDALLQAREALGLALGSSESYGVVPGVSLDEIERSARATCTPVAPSGRTDVLAARAELDIASRKVTEAELSLAPTLDLGSTATYSSVQLANARSYAWSIQGILTIPIWDGGARDGAVRAAKAGVVEQSDRLEASTRGATVEANHAMRAVAVAERQRDLSARAVELARRTARLSQAAFETGTGTSFELVDSAKRLREAELDLAVRELDLVRAKMAALLSSGNCGR